MCSFSFSKWIPLFAQASNYTLMLTIDHIFSIVKTNKKKIDSIRQGLFQFLTILVPNLSKASPVLVSSDLSQSRSVQFIHLCSVHSILSYRHLLYIHRMNEIIADEQFKTLLAGSRMFNILKTNTHVLGKYVVWNRTKLNNKNPFELVKLVGALRPAVTHIHTWLCS